MEEPIWITVFLMMCVHTGMDVRYCPVRYEPGELLLLKLNVKQQTVYLGKNSYKNVLVLKAPL